MKSLPFFLLMISAAICNYAKAQLSIDHCQQLARAHYPIVKRYDMIKQTAAYNLSNAGKGYLPQFLLSAKATYQSETVVVPLQIPGMQIEIPSPYKDQYAATLDMAQSIWDGGAVRAQKQMISAGANVEQEQLNVDMYALEKRVNQLFFGILLWEAQIEQNRILQADLQRSCTLVEACVQNGLSNYADLDAVSVERLKAIQFEQQLMAGRRAYIEMLSVMIGQHLDESVSFEKPDVRAMALSTQVDRPELKLFDAQNQLFETQKNTITAGYMPRFNLFLQGGYGRPGLNMLDRNASPFFIGGIRMSWNFGALYTRKNDLLKLALNQQNVETLRETFLYHTNIEVTQQNIQIERIQKMMQYDDEIIALRENIRRSAESKVANGTLSVTELMRELNAESLSKQEKMKHEIELITAIYDLKYSTNN